MKKSFFIIGGIVLAGTAVYLLVKNKKKTATAETNTDPSKIPSTATTPLTGAGKVAADVIASTKQAVQQMGTLFGKKQVETVVSPAKPQPHVDGWLN